MPLWLRAALAALLLTTGCGGWRGNTYLAQDKREEATFRFGEPGSGWRPLREARDVQVAWVNPDIGAVIHLHGQCADQGDSSLEQYTDHLRIDWTDWEVVSQTEETLIGRAALRTVVTAKLDGVPRKNEFVVVKKSGCLFDLMLSARPDAFDAARPAFVRVVEGFRFPVGGE